MPFPLKRSERIYKQLAQNRTEQYTLALGFIKKFFEGAGYQTAEDVGCLRFKRTIQQRRIKVVANLLARKEGTQEVACVLFFPREKSISTTKVIERLHRLNVCFEQIAVFLCGINPLFPFIADRISLAIPNVLLWRLTLPNGKIAPIQIYKPKTKEETKNII